MKSIFRFLLLAFTLFINMNPLSAQWVQTNGPYGGFVSAFAVSSTNLFVGTGGGVFLSTNNGTSWTAVNAGLIAPVQSLAVSNTNLFAGTTGAGVFLSTNNGTSWTAVNSSLTNGQVQSLAVSGTNLFAGTADGVFRSTNNGASWTVANAGLMNRFVLCLAVSSTNLFAGTNGGGVFLSTNNGTSWTAVNSGLMTPIVLSLAVNSTNLFAGTVDGVFRSTNNGTSWTAVNAGLTNRVVHSLAVSGTNLFAGTADGLFRSTNNGTSWTAVNAGLTNTYVLSFAISSTNLFMGTGGGVFLSTNNGTSWTAVNAGLTNTYVPSFAVSGTNLFAGTYGAGVFLSTNNGASWTAVNSGLTNTYVSSFAVSSTNIFMGTSSAGIFLSTNNGASWTTVNSGLTNIGIHSLAVSGTNLFAGTADGLFRSTNNGTSWTAVNSGLTNTDVWSLAVSGTNLFAGTNGDGVFLTTNNGTSWTEVSSGLTNRVVFSLAVRSTNLFAGTNGGGVFLSTNNGTSWTAVNSGLTNTCVSSFAVSSTNLFVGTIGGGVFRSTNTGTSWTAVNADLTSTIVSSLAISGTNLFAGTMGSGVWRRPLSEMLTTEITFNPNPDGWGFRNSWDNMWPREWWHDKFDYCKDPYPSDWCNWASSYDFPDWPLFVEAFGEDVCYIVPPPFAVYHPTAVLTWRAFKESWGGSCFGFAISSFLFYDNMLSLPPTFPENLNLIDVPLNDKSRNVINLYFVHQYGWQHLLHKAANFFTTPLWTLNKIKEMFNSPVSDDRVLMLERGPLKTGVHVVNPYKLTVGETVDTVYIYDNNYPGQEKKILVDKERNIWEYPAMPDWGGNSVGFYLMDPVSSYLDRPRLIGSSQDPVQYVQVYNSESDATIIASTGDSIGYRRLSGLSFSTFTNAFPIVPATGSEHPPIGYFLPIDSYRVQLSNFADTTMVFSVLSDSSALSLERGAMRGDQIETINFNMQTANMQVINKDLMSKMYNMQSIIDGFDNSKVFRIDQCDISHGDTLELRREHSDNLQISNRGNNKTYDLQLRAGSRVGEQVFEYKRVSMSANTEHKIVPNWKEITRDLVTILIDTNMNGQWDDTLRLANQYGGGSPQTSGPLSNENIYTYPNPFNPETEQAIFRFKLGKGGNVRITVYDVSNRKVREVISNVAMSVGTEQSISWNGRNENGNIVSNGVYFYIIESSSGERAVGKIAVLR